MKKQDIRAAIITGGATLWAAVMYWSILMLDERFRPLPIILTGVALAAYVIARISEPRR